MKFYLTVIKVLANYFKSNNWKKLFLEGGCYWFADFLRREIYNSVLMFNKCEEHCALYFEHGLYDVTGKISSKNYRCATNRNINYMKKNYVPHFNVDDLEQYLIVELKDLC